jgi:hypothetical protein
MDLAGNLAALFRRDLSVLRRQIESFPDEEMLWRTVPGITNSAGNLALHLEGNLREYIGRQLGGLPYTRERPLEFDRKGIRREELVARVAELVRIIPRIVGELSREQMAKEYPEVGLEAIMSTEGLLIHLYGHLTWHLGQIDYVRRAITGGGAIERPRL